jgi:putative transposase
MRKKYPTDLSNAKWNCLRPYLPNPKAEGRPRIHSLRDVLGAIFYVLKSGCHWRLLPHDFPPWSTVYYHFRRFRLSGLWSLIPKVLRAIERKRAGKDPQPTAAIMDSQSVKTVEESAHPSGYDTPTRTSKGASSTSWWTPWAFRSRFTSLRPTYKIG